MKKSILIVCLLAGLLVSCHKEAKVEIKDDGANVSFVIPDEASAATLINAQTALSNSFTIKAERERQAFELQKMELKKEERQFYFFFGVFAVVTGIVAVFAVACMFVFLYFGGVKSWQK